MTLKNTSFNSVSRNLLAGEAVVATFVTHGGLGGPGPKSAPLVTISSFGDKPVPLRGGVKTTSSSLGNSHRGTTGGGGPTHTAWFGGVRPLDQEMKIKKEVAAQPEQKKPEAEARQEPEEPEEKFTSFCDPTPADNDAEECVTSFTSEAASEEEGGTVTPVSVTPITSTGITSTRTTTAGITTSGITTSGVTTSGITTNGITVSTDSSKRSSTLSRKAPVFKEKPHVPIKPSPDAPESKLPEFRKRSSSPPPSSTSSVRLNKTNFILGPWNGNSRTGNSSMLIPQPHSLDSSPPSSIQSAKLNKPPTPFKIGAGRKLSTHETAADSAAPQQPDSGGFSVRFVHSQSTDDAMLAHTPESRPAQSKSSESKSPEPKPSELKPSEVKPSELQLAELKSSELKSLGLKAVELKSTALKAPELKSELKLPELRSTGFKSPGLRSPGLKSPGFRPIGFQTLGLKASDLKPPELKSSNPKLPELISSKSPSPVSKRWGSKSPVSKSPGSKSPESKSPESKSPESKSPEPESPEPKSPERKSPELKVPESSAISRLDQLSTSSPPELKKESDVIPPPPPESEKISRSSFEQLRANLAGSLELTRLGPSSPPSGSPFRQENSVSKENLAPEVIHNNPNPEISDGEFDDDDDDDEFRPSPILPGEAIVETVNLFAINRRRSGAGGSGSGSDVIPVKPHIRSASAQGRTPVISLTPDECSGSHQEGHLRSSSVTSRHLDLMPEMTHSKTPSIRKIIRQTASQLRQLAETGTRLSRSDRFALEGGNRKTGFNTNGGNNKTRFGKSIRKLLGMKKDSASSKNFYDAALDAEGVLANVHKIRPEIVHPLDFHPPGQVEVVTQKPDSAGIRDPMMISPNWIRGLHNESPVTSASRSASAAPSAAPSAFSHSASFSGGSSPVHQTSSPAGGRGKPPPPPRANHLNSSGSSDQAGSASRSRTATVAGSGGSVSQRPKRPPPPKAPELLLLQKSPSPESPPGTGATSSGNSAGEYANLGDIRHGMTPKKPERSASLRHSNQNMSVPGQKKYGDSVHYGCVAIQHQHSQQQPQQQQQQQQQQEAADEDGYIIPVRMRSLSQSFSAATSPSHGHRHSMTSFNPPCVENSAGSPQNGAAHSASRSENNNNINNNKWNNNRSADLRMKMEDHYGTVISANYQALSQLLDQATSKRPLAAHLHEMRRVESQLSWSSFEATSTDAVLLRTRRAALLTSRWRCHDVLLLVYPMTHHVDSVENKAPFAQPSVVHFNDPTTPPTPLHLPFRNCGVEVFPAGQVASLDELAPLLSRQYDRAETVQRGLVALLQLLRALSWLRLKRHEVRRHPELDEIVFYREGDDDVHRLIWMATSKTTSSAPNAAGIDDYFCMSVVERLAPALTPQLVDKLTTIDGIERMIGYIELTLFGPPDELSDPDIIQRWLDVERASVLNELIRTQGLWRIKLTVMEEFRLAYLVVANVANLIEASRI